MRQYESGDLGLSPSLSAILEEGALWNLQLQRRFVDLLVHGMDQPVHQEPLASLQFEWQCISVGRIMGALSDYLANSLLFMSLTSTFYLLCETQSKDFGTILIQEIWDAAMASCKINPYSDAS